MLKFKMSCRDVKGDGAAVLPSLPCLVWPMVPVPALFVCRPASP